MTIIDWFISFGVSIIFSIVFAFILKKNIMVVFITFFTMFIGIFVVAGMIPLWTLILSTIAMIFILYYNVRGFAK